MSIFKTWRYIGRFSLLHVAFSGLYSVQTDARRLDQKNVIQWQEARFSDCLPCDSLHLPNKFYCETYQACAEPLVGVMTCGTKKLCLCGNLEGMNLDAGYVTELGSQAATFGYTWLVTPELVRHM